MDSDCIEWEWLPLFRANCDVAASLRPPHEELQSSLQLQANCRNNVQHSAHNHT